MFARALPCAAARRGGRAARMLPARRCFHWRAHGTVRALPTSGVAWPRGTAVHARGLAAAEDGGPSVAVVKGLQATVAELARSGEWDQAYEAATECTEYMKLLTGVNHPGHASCLNNLAYIQKSRGELEAAATAYEEALRVYKLCYGDGHNSVLTTMHNLAYVYKATGESERALKISDDTLAAREKQEGTPTRDIAISLYTSGAILTDMQQLTKGEGLLRRAVGLLEPAQGGTATGQDEVALATAKNNLALCLKIKGSYEESEDLYLRVIDNRVRLLGESHPDTIAATHNLAELYHAVGDTERAHRLRQHLVTMVHSGQDAPTA